MRKRDAEFHLYNGKTEKKDIERVEARKFLKRDYLECMVRVLWNYWEEYTERLYT